MIAQPIKEKLQEAEALKRTLQIQISSRMTKTIIIREVHIQLLLPDLPATVLLPTRINQAVVLLALVPTPQEEVVAPASLTQVLHDQVVVM